MGTVRIAHISDLHFGVKNGQEATWQILKKHLRDQIEKKLFHLVLVTGDIVDSPKEDILGKARDELDSWVWITSSVRATTTATRGAINGRNCGVRLTS